MSNLIVRPNSPGVIQYPDCPCCKGEGTVSRVPGGWYTCSSCKDAFDDDKYRQANTIRAASPRRYTPQHSRNTGRKKHRRRRTSSPLLRYVLIWVFSAVFYPIFWALLASIVGTLKWVFSTHSETYLSYVGMYAFWGGLIGFLHCLYQMNLAAKAEWWADTFANGIRKANGGRRANKR